ncbi:MAG: hypothetical protein GY810_24445 [Aureispira sp.]|nr:hypothetical protein [Aureispira sp.]
MKLLTILLSIFISSNIFAQHDYSDEFKIFLERSEISLTVLDGYKLEKQVAKPNVHYLYFYNSNTKTGIHYRILPITEYMKGNSKKNKKSAKEKKEEKENMFHPNNSYKMTFDMLLMKQNSQKVMSTIPMRAKDLSGIFHADWGVSSGVATHNKPGEEGPLRQGFSIHKKDVATIIVFVSGFEEETLFNEFMNTMVKVSFKKED